MADLTSLGPLRLPVRRYTEFEHVPGFALIATEAADVAALAGTDTVVLSVTETPDVVVVSVVEPELIFTLDTTEASDVAALIGTDNVLLEATEGSDIAELSGAVETTGLVSLGPHRLPVRKYGSFEHIEAVTSEFALAATEAADAAAFVGANDSELVLDANESADVSVFNIVRQGDIVLSASEGADIALTEFAFRGQAPEPEGSGFSWRKQKPFLPYRENIFLRSSEESDEASFRIMEWTLTNDGQRVLRRRRNELVLMMVAHN